eukprot:TRINITY_DN2981_c0_g4_i1.p2 TRINITY_DN2981_c0_g4~~TRINITY_DN2981_c0_g4_i1.p2  ORF type:complete len:169 (+),score=24.02 TRINITY_DN2981_c0_g4_i1:56-562(+)
MYFQSGSFFFFFSSRRRHTRSCLVSWARRCVQETVITPQDKELLAKKGISESQIAGQLSCFVKGFPYLKLDAAASVDKGILLPDTDVQKDYLSAWEEYINQDKTIVKFVPASGAASRMFKNLFEFLGAEYNQPTTEFEKDFFAHIANFAFYEDLKAACLKNENPCTLR